MPPRPRAARLGLCAAATLALAGTAHAQTRDDPGKTRAAALVERAQRVCGRGAHAEALTALVEAFRLYPHPRIRYRGGVEHQHLGQLVEAIEAFESYLSEPEREPEYVADAVSRMNLIRPGLGNVDILAETGVAVEVDGRARGRTPMSRLRLVAGNHRITLRKPGFRPVQTTVHVVPGQTTPVPVALTPEGPAPAPASPAPTSPAPTSPAASSPVASSPAASSAGYAPPLLTDPALPPLAPAFQAPGPAGASPIEIGLLFSGGVWTTGIGETGTTLGAAVGGAYRLPYRLLGKGLTLHVGPRVTVNTISDLGRTAYATGFLVAPQVRLEVVPRRVRASFELGTGLLVVWGLLPRSMVLIPESSEVTGGLSTFALRPVLSFEYLLGPDIAFLMGMAAAWSPRPDPAFRQRFLVRIDFAVGLSWAL